MTKRRPYTQRDITRWDLAPHDTRDRSWMQFASCRGADTATWFPHQGEDVRPAKTICADCPVRQPCAEYGMGESHGIFGGLTERQRIQLTGRKGRTRRAG
ncbi:MAG TPA: WhiB family transcriptional regulator [Acidimicrobiales bacterium]|nr:WhiB family transcriptional regulator [Acidimicrobiales bacterium]